MTTDIIKPLTDNQPGMKTTTSTMSLSEIISDNHLRYKETVNKLAVLSNSTLDLKLYESNILDFNFFRNLFFNLPPHDVRSILDINQISIFDAFIIILNYNNITIFKEEDIILILNKFFLFHLRLRILFFTIRLPMERPLLNLFHQDAVASIEKKDVSFNKAIIKENSKLNNEQYLHIVKQLCYQIKSKSLDIRSKIRHLIPESPIETFASLIKKNSYPPEDGNKLILTDKLIFEVVIRKLIFKEVIFSNINLNKNNIKQLEGYLSDFVLLLDFAYICNIVLPEDIYSLITTKFIKIPYNKLFLEEFPSKNVFANIIRIFDIFNKALYTYVCNEAQERSIKKAVVVEESFENKNT